MEISIFLNKLGVKNNKLFSFGKEKLSVADVNFYEKVFSYKGETTVDYVVTNNFLDECKIERLNHLGVGYSISDISKEIIYLSDNIKGSKLYSEESNAKKTKWLFIGDNNHKKIVPMFEVVLFERKSKPKKPTLWIPHFQIDYDTKLDYSELVKLSEKHFGKNIFTWKLDIPQYGVVLAMGSIGKIDGVSIMLGIGTVLRDSVYHRKQMKPL